MKYQTEINHNEAIISLMTELSQNQNNNYSIGQVISMENTKKPKSKLYTQPVCKIILTEAYLLFYPETMSV